MEWNEYLRVIPRAPCLDLPWLAFVRTTLKASCEIERQRGDEAKGDYFLQIQTSLVGARDGLDHMETQVPVATIRTIEKNCRPCNTKMNCLQSKSLGLMLYTQEVMVCRQEAIYARCFMS